MDFMDISKMRITVRKYSQMKVESEKVEKILEAGRCQAEFMFGRRPENEEFTSG